MMGLLEKAEFGAQTFFASSHSNDQCGANGLPLTPNSIKILGRFQKLKALSHPRLCTYLDLERAKHERIIVVHEHYKDSLDLWLKTNRNFQPDFLLRVAFEVLDGLSHLNKHGIVHRNLSPGNVLFTPEKATKLGGYGLYHMTGGGADVLFPIGYTRYLAPEVLLQGPSPLKDQALNPDQVLSSPKVDVWSLGIILMEILIGQKLWEDLSLSQIFHKIIRFIGTDINPVDLILKETNYEEKFQSLQPDVQVLLRSCLTVSANKRPSPSDLLNQLSVFKALQSQQTPVTNGFRMHSTELRCADLEIPAYEEDQTTLDADGEDHLGQRGIQEVYYFWKLAGGDLETILRREGLIKSHPPITITANFITEDGEVFGQQRNHGELYDDTVVILAQDTLRQRLQNIDEASYYPLLEDESTLTNNLPTSPSSGDLSQTATLPLIIREKDIEYQFHRSILYHRLLCAYPYKRQHIWKEARVDIPPIVRGHVWSALLEVEGDIQGVYDAIDKETVTPTDRQIEVDIPRCHQYNELLSSPEGHAKFKRVLKAWVVSHPQYVYWQGLDSLCAPFLYLNFNDEALAYACLSAFIPKYLHKFFLKDNSLIIQEYLAVFTHLIAFHDPELSSHLDGIGFIPDLYAIPWFLTMYAHVFPLHKVFHLWDTLLLGNSSFPLCIGVAILQQLRDQLLSFGFNECILLFSDMPGIDIGQCVQDSIKIFCSTPKSATYRQHARPPRNKADPKSAARPNLSYYSTDYHDLPSNELSMEPIPLEDLKAEKCPRISAEDLIELSEMSGPALSRSPTKKRESSKPKILIIDSRTQDEHLRGTLPGSINIPFNSAFGPDGSLYPCPALTTLNSSKFQVKVIIGNRGRNASHFAAELVRLGYSKVCVLHKGIDVLRPTGLLTVPSPEI